MWKTKAASNKERRGYRHRAKSSNRLDHEKPCGFGNLLDFIFRVMESLQRNTLEEESVVREGKDPKTVPVSYSKELQEVLAEGNEWWSGTGHFIEKRHLERKSKLQAFPVRILSSNILLHNVSRTLPPIFFSCYKFPLETNICNK